MGMLALEIFRRSLPVLQVLGDPQHKETALRVHPAEGSLFSEKDTEHL